MEFETWRPWFQIVFLDLKAWDYVLLATNMLLIALALIHFRRDFKFGRHQFFLFTGLLAASLLTNNFLVLSFPRADLLPPIEVPIKPAAPFAPLLGVLPIFAAGTWLGAGPAMLVGLVSGILRLDTTVSGIAEPFRFAACYVKITGERCRALGDSLSQQPWWQVRSQHCFSSSLSAT